MEDEITSDERARIDELQKFSSWLKSTFHTGDFAGEESSTWINYYAEKKYDELQSEIDFHLKLIKERKELIKNGK